MSIIRPLFWIITATILVVGGCSKTENSPIPTSTTKTEDAKIKKTKEDPTMPVSDGKNYTKF
jgi:hypothetical protein